MTRTQELLVKVAAILETSENNVRHAPLMNTIEKLVEVIEHDRANK